jgi:chromosome segregation ATPase
MTRADIETMLHELAATTRYLQDNGRLMRETAEHLGEAADRIVTVNERLQAMGARVEAAITAGLTHLHGDEES